MTRLGTCSMIIEPHIFEVTLYSVKDAPIVYNPLPAQPPPYLTPQHAPYTPNGAGPAPTFSAPSNIPYSTHQTSQPPRPAQPLLPPFSEGFGSFGPQGPSSFRPPPLQPLAPIGPTTPSDPLRPQNVNQDSATSQPANGNPKPDLVIQMLATRAASNAELKALMKIVASGRASPVQLREFQDHIDELNSIIKSRQNSSDMSRSQSNSGIPPQDEPKGSPDSMNQAPKPSMPWSKPESLPAHPIPYQTPTPIKVEPMPRTSPAITHPIMSKPPNHKRSDIDGVVFDFGGSGDRFSFPRFSILEYLYGGTQVIASFLVIRRGNTASSGKYKGNMSYYQPVTVRLTSPHPKLLEPLSRIVASPDEVRSYMNSFFDKLSPAEEVYLATRLPRSTEAQDLPVPDAIQSDAKSTYQVYSPPNSIMPLAA